MSASPASYAFPLDDDVPNVVTVTRSAGSFSSLTLSVADPTVVGATTPVLHGSTATFTEIPVARGATTISAVDGSGASASVAVSTALCGRPPSLVGAQLLAPAAGSHAPSTVGTVFFLAYFVNGVPVSGNVHLIVGAHGTLEGGALAPATAPPGTVFPTPLPLPNATTHVVSAAVPALPTGTTIGTQLYNDTCQGPLVAGSFST